MPQPASGSGLCARPASGGSVLTLPPQSSVGWDGVSTCRRLLAAPAPGLAHRGQAVLQGPSHMSSEARKGPALGHSSGWLLAELGQAPGAGPGLVSAYPGLTPTFPQGQLLPAQGCPGQGDLAGWCSGSRPVLSLTPGASPGQAQVLRARAAHPVETIFPLLPGCWAWSHQGSLAYWKTAPKFPGAGTKHTAAFTAQMLEQLPRHRRLLLTDEEREVGAQPRRGRRRPCSSEWGPLDHPGLLAWGAPVSPGAAPRGLRMWLPAELGGLALTPCSWLSQPPPWGWSGKSA